jgi:hypothetical protein
MYMQSRNLTLATEQIRRASKILPPGAISGISVGNEPDSYMWVVISTSRCLCPRVPAQVAATRVQGHTTGQFLPPFLKGVVVGFFPSLYIPPCPRLAHRYRKVGYKDYMQREDEQSYFADQLSYMRALAPILKDWLGTAQVFQGEHEMGPGI